MEFDVFLCHNSQDKPEVKDIAETLKQQGLRPWLDEWQLQPGLPWQRELEKQIQNIKSAAVFVGGSGIGPWQQMEIEAYLRRFVKQGCPVIPVLLPNAPNQPDLPLFLEGMTWVDFRRLSPKPIERLIWGITGINLRSPSAEPSKPPNIEREKVILSLSQGKRIVSEIADLLKEREACNSQYRSAIDDAQRVRLKRKLDDLDKKIDDLERQLHGM